MKLKTSTGRKIRYGGASIAITALIIALAVIINATVTILTQRFMWYGDMTPEPHFTISEKCYELLGDRSDDSVDTPVEKIDDFRAENKKYNADNGLSEGDEGYRDEALMINILFASEKDKLEATDTTLYVHENAEELRAKFPDYISTEYVDSVRNPKRFQKYLSSNIDKIGSESVIIEFGSEFRIHSIRSFYRFDSKSGDPYAYNGEQVFASSILAITRAETPLACYTVNHGESFPLATEKDDSGNERVPFLDTLEAAGYKTQALDLSKEEIPEECRLLITYNPKQDFIAGNTGFEAQGELKKLDDFLEDRNSFMVFLEPTTGKLDNLEEFLGEWGLQLRREGDTPLVVKDAQHSNLGNNEAVIGNYAVNDIMDGWGENLSAKVIFEDAMVIDYAESQGYHPSTEKLATDETKTFEMAMDPDTKRMVFPLLTSFDTASAYASGTEIAKATPTDPFKLMCVSVDTRYTSVSEQLNTIADSAFVMLAGTTEFASDKYLYSNSYGNEDFLLTAFRMSGRDPVPVGIDFKMFANFEIEEISTGTATKYIVILTVAPIVLALCAGAFVLVRRKNR